MKLAIDLLITPTMIYIDFNCRSSLIILSTLNTLMILITLKAESEELL